MGCRLFRLLIVLAVFSPFVFSQWQPGPTLPTTGPREAPVAILKNGQIYLFGGSPVDGSGGTPVQILSVSQTTWSTSTPFESDFRFHGTQIDSLGRFVVWFGVDSGGGEGDSFEWTIADGDAGGIEAPSSQAATQLFSQARDDAGLVYTIGGSLSGTRGTSTPVTGRVERYNGASDTWSVMATMPTPVSNAAACNDGLGHILVLGGITASGTRTANVARYDVATNTWSDSAVADLPVAISALSALRAADGRIYAIGGNTGTVQATTWVLDLMTNVWTAGPSLATARQHFGCVLDDAGFIWAMGGSSTNTVETLYTPTLAHIVEQPSVANAFLGGPAGFGLIVTGTAPFSYQWRKDGSPLSDGTTGTGSTVVGSQDSSLGIREVGFADQGSYDCVITNAAGSVTSSAAPIQIKIPTAIPATFGVTNLHPGGGLGSVAWGVDEGLIGGESSYTHPTYGTLSQPVTWSGTAASAQVLTPPNSVGGSISAVKNGTMVGWWWWPYTNQFGTGYDRHAAIWSNYGATFSTAQPSGWEFGHLSDTDGVHHCGSLTYDESSTNADGFYWPGNSTYAQKLTPPANWGSAAYAIDGGHEYGSVHIGYGVVHAAKWSAGDPQWADMNPVGATRSYIFGAGDDQQVGRAYYGSPSESGVFAGSAQSFVSFDPTQTLNVNLTDCEAGLQVGSATLNGVSGAKIWAGSATSMLDLHQFLSANFSSSTANAIDVGADGLVTIVGSAFDSIAGANRAIMWQGQAPSLWQDVEQVSASAGGVFHMFIDAGTTVAGQVYAIVGSASGTMPGVTIGQGQLLPLNPDFYLDQTILYPNSWIVPSFAYLDSFGRQIATATLPAGALYVVYPVTIHHALVVISPGGSGFDLISPPVALTILP